MAGPASRPASCTLSEREEPAARGRNGSRIKTSTARRGTMPPPLDRAQRKPEPKHRVTTPAAPRRCIPASCRPTPGKRTNREPLAAYPAAHRPEPAGRLFCRPWGRAAGYPAGRTTLTQACRRYASIRIRYAFGTAYIPPVEEFHMRAPASSALAHANVR